jgi:ribonuclease HII
MLIIGIDDAGRGPIIGPMILAGVLIDNSSEGYLKEIGAKDSKIVAHPKRVELSKLIKKACLGYEVALSSPDLIDNSINSGTNLNHLEAIKTAEIINKLNNNKEKIKVIVDCPSVNTLAWKNTLIDYVKHKENLEIHCEHKADANYPVVSAASIIAKVVREEEVEKIAKKYGEIGSGYPSDPKTKKFLKERGLEFKDEGIFRKTWETWKKLYPVNSQSTLF